MSVFLPAPPRSPLTKVKLINELNEREVQLGVADKVSWHSEYKDSAWIFLGEVHIFFPRCSSPGLLPNLSAFPPFIPPSIHHALLFPSAGCPVNPFSVSLFSPISSLLPLSRQFP